MFLVVEGWVDGFLLLMIVRMVIVICGVGLLDFQQYIVDWCFGVVDNLVFNGDVFFGGISGSEDWVKIFFKNMKVCGVWCQVDMNIGFCCL